MCVSIILNCFVRVFPAFALNCICVQTSVYLWCMCTSVCDRWLGCPPRPCSSGAHAGGLRRSPCVCVLFAGVFPPCVCVPWQRVFSPRRPGINAAALMAADGELWGSRGNLPDEHTRRKTKHFEILWCFFFLIQGYSWAESDSRADSLLLLLPNQRQLSLPEGALLHSVGVFENYTHSVRLHDT